MLDYFHKYGTTLILCFEQGEAEYSHEALLEIQTHVAYYEGGGDITGFCLENIRTYQPDRIYVEMNTMTPGLRDKLPDIMDIRYVTTRIDWATLGLYFNNFKQMISQMVAESHQITFQGCPSKDLLAPYRQAFRLMNRKASYLRQDPMGYHEKAFDLYVPFSLEETVIEITQGTYLPLWLDAMDHPEHYEGKSILFTDPLELRRNDRDGPWSAGRVVMTCCMADLQYMSFELTGDAAAALEGGWVKLDTLARVGTAEYGRRVLQLHLVRAEPAMPPAELILSAANATE